MTNTGSTPDRHALTFTKKSPTHQFIETLDVVLELCKHLCHSHWKKSLLAFGSTCRTLFEPAMDVLWCCLDVIVDLLKVIPNFVRVNKHFIIQGPLSDGILSRFDMYARRVRVLSRGLFPECHPSSFACTYLSSFRRLLVPGLREIHIDDVYEDDWAILLLLCSTTLKDVSLIFADGDQDGRMIGGFLRSLGCDGSHGLERLCILTTFCNHVDLITKFHMLQDVQLRFSEETTGTLLIEGFSKLSALNHLSKLSVEWHTDNEHHQIVSTLLPHSVNFQSLHSIEIMAPAYMALLLIQCLGVDTTLKRIQINCHSCPLQQPTAFRRIVGECGLIAPSLEEVDLDFNVDQPIGLETFDAVLDIIRRSCLWTLRFAWTEFEIDDAYIHKACLSGCFSHLEVLDLVTYGASSPTFQVLRSLAIHCPVLKELDMSFTVEEAHLPLLVKEMENERPLSHCLKNLTIRLKDQPETAEIFTNKFIPIISQYLDSLFPSLDLCHAFGQFRRFTFVEGIRQTLKALQHRPAMDSRRLVGSHTLNL